MKNLGLCFCLLLCMSFTYAHAVELEDLQSDWKLTVIDGEQHSGEDVLRIENNNWIIWTGHTFLEPIQFKVKVDNLVLSTVVSEKVNKVKLLSGDDLHIESFIGDDSFIYEYKKLKERID